MKKLLTLMVLAAFTVVVTNHEKVVDSIDGFARRIFGNEKPAAHEILWINEARDRAKGLNANGVLIGHIYLETGTKWFEMGIRDDGVLVARETSAQKQ